MKITFLGTGTSQGIPVIGCTHEVCSSKNPKDKRLRSSVLVQWDDQTIVIDCGPDFRQQMLANKVTDINGIIFTHFHADHTAGLDDIRPFSQKYGCVPLYGEKEVIENLEERYEYIFTKENKYWGAPSVEINIIEHEPFKLGGIEVIPIKVKHGRLDIFGFRFDNLAYITDGSSVPDKEKEKLQNLDILIVNALRIEPHPTHFNLQAALNLIEEVQPKKAYLTHISHRLGFHDEVSKILPENVFLAYDELVVSSFANL
ncbi:MAG: MBL fold metallo-hydrolase [Bacteroidota bacterium]